MVPCAWQHLSYTPSPRWLDFSVQSNIRSKRSPTFHVANQEGGGPLKGIHTAMPLRPSDESIDSDEPPRTLVVRAKDDDWIMGEDLVLVVSGEETIVQILEVSVAVACACQDTSAHSRCSSLLLESILRKYSTRAFLLLVFVSTRK